MRLDLRAGFPIANVCGQIYRVAGLSEDITNHKNSDAELQKAKEAAEEANRAKSEFLANMSHEIRTPMTAIMGFAEMMLGSNQEPADRTECVQIIRRNAQHLLELVNGILDLSKIEAGKMSVERIAFDLPQFLADIISTMRPRAQEKGLAFEISFVGPDSPAGSDRRAQVPPDPGEPAGQRDQVHRQRAHRDVREL